MEIEKTKPQVSVVVCSYKNPDLLRLCLKSIKENIQGLNCEIIVADNATEEATFDLMREEFSDLVFIPNKKNDGFSHLVNRGIARARGDFFLVINADIIFKDDAIRRLYEFAKSDDKIGMVGPKLVNFDNSIQQSCFRFYNLMTIVYRRTFLGRFDFAKKEIEKFKMSKEQTSGNKPIEVDWLMGSAMMVPRKVVEKVGAMDEGFFMYFEDVDWCYRMHKKGFKVIYYPLAKAYHYHGKASASRNSFFSLLFNKYARIHVMSALRFFIKHWGKRRVDSK